MSWWRENKEWALFAVSTVLLVAGGVAWLLDADTTANLLWIVGTVLGLVFSIGWMVASIRRGQLSVDVIAVLALAGALVVSEPFAGAMITVMLASGQLLEARAAARARRELSLLVQRAPRTARRHVESGVVEVAGGRRRDRGSPAGRYRRNRPGRRQVALPRRPGRVRAHRGTAAG